jgi:hypothetical protein
MANEFVIKRGYISQGDSSITGSLVVTGGVTGSFSGSYVGDGSGLTGVGAFPFTGSALITGSLGVTGSASILATTATTASIFSVRNNTNLRDIIKVQGNENTIIQSGQYSTYTFTQDYNNAPSFIGKTSGNTTFELGNDYGASPGNVYTGALKLYNYSSVLKTRIQAVGISYWLDSSAVVSIGSSTNGARLDVRAQGALSTDIAFRVRNSADTRDLINIRGNKTIELIADTPATNGGISISAASVYNEPIINTYNGFGTNIMRFDSSARVIGINGSGDIRIGSFSGNGYLGMVTPTSNNRFLKLVDAFGSEYLSIGGNSFDGGGGVSLTLKTTTNNGTNFITFSKSNNTNKFIISDQANVGIGQETFGTSSKFVLAVANGTAPTTSPVDSFQQYSADIIAGNAAPHFRTEAGNIVKLYTQAAVTSSQGLADILTNVGLLATGSNIVTAYERLSDFQSPYHYSGNATLGTSTSSINWIINRIDFTTPGSPITLQGTGSWDNRTSLIYS